MSTTTIKLTINHNTKLPDGLTDVVADRAYQYIHAKGGQAGDVTAEIVDLITLPVVSLPEVKEQHARLLRKAVQS